MGRLQWWLQGHPTASRPYPVDRGRIATWVGNRISDARYWAWRLGGGTLA